MQTEKRKEQINMVENPKSLREHGSKSTVNEIKLFCFLPRNVLDSLFNLFQELHWLEVFAVMLTLLIVKSFQLLFSSIKSHYEKKFTKSIRPTDVLQIYPSI